jgi:coenzyme F420-dependent glucose-6-phosphate dehydrogenase
LSDPREMFRRAEDEISDEEFAHAYIIGSDPDRHVQRIREIEEMGATVVCLQNASGADPLRALEIYGERVLPALQGGRTAAATGS